MLDTQFTTTCRTTSESADIVSSTTCSDQCMALPCSGPGPSSCNVLLQLTSEKTPILLQNQVLQWSASDPHMQGKTINTSDYSVSAWFYDLGDPTLTRGLIKVQNIDGDHGVMGQRLAGIYRINDSTVTLYADTLQGAEVSASVATNYYVRPTQSQYTGNWYYVAFAWSPTKIKVVYANPGDSFETIKSLTKTPIPFGGSYTTAKIMIGDPYLNGYTGKVANVRFYPNTHSGTDYFSYQDGSLQSFCLIAPTCMTCTQCEDSFFQSAEVCFRKVHAECAPECLTCAEKPWNCLTCQPNFLLQSSHLCLPICPSGSVANAGACDRSDQTIADFKFDIIAGSISGGTGLTAINGAVVNTPPNYEIFDALPCKNRGYYFNGGQYFQIQSGSPLVLPDTITFSTWMRPQGSGYIYTKKKDNDEIFSVKVKNDYTVEFDGGYPNFSYTLSTPLSADTWTFLAITISFSPATGKSTVTFYFDGVQQQTPVIDYFYIRDVDEDAFQIIGASTTLTDFYKGFIWRITIRNYQVTTLQSEIASPSCPSGLSHCLSACPFLQTHDCQACLPSCTKGCVRTTDCSLCAEEMCDVCSRFDTVQCTTCVPQAILSTACGCSSNSFYDAVGRACVMCPTLCSACSSLSVCSSCVNNASTSGGLCLCISSAYQSGSQCLLCDGACATCANGTSSGCLTCKANAQLAATAPSSCVCISSAFTTIDASNCQLCDETCNTCSLSATHCTSCLTDAHIVGGACQCDSIAYPFPTASNCQRCHSTCATCDNGTAVGCTSCFPSAVLSGEFPAACICESIYYPAPDVIHCARCHASCGTCSGPSENDCISCLELATLVGPQPNACQCTLLATADPSNCSSCSRTCSSCAQPLLSDKCQTCKLHAHLVSASPSSCQCDAGTFGSLDSSNCLTCHLTCRECSGATDADCLECKNNAELAALAPSACHCSKGYYPEPDATSCVKCDDTCKECIHDTPLKCTVCYPFAELAGSSPNQCVCVVGYFTATDTSHCQPCNALCSRCPTGASKCTECVSRAHQPAESPGSCVCDSNAYLSTSQCILCDTACVTCAGPGPAFCTSCSARSRLTSGFPGACVCEEGFYRNGAGCTACHSTCQQCANQLSSSCTTCGQNSILAGSAPAACSCVSGYRREATDGPCVKCINYFASASLRAYIDVTFTKLIVEFPKPVDTSLLKSCDRIFATQTLDRLGNNPVCNWSSDQSVLVVLLGKSYLVRKETITLISANIGAVDGNCAAVKSDLTSMISYQSTRAAAIPAISGPNNYSALCGNGLKLSVTGTTGLGALGATYKWGLVLAPNLQQIDLFGKYSENNVDIVIPNEKLSGSALNATVYLKDSFDAEGSAWTIITLNGQNDLQVTLESPSLIKTVTTQALKVTSDVSLGCDKQLDFAISYNWKIAQSTSDKPVSFTASSPQLYVEPRQLQPRDMYEFQLTVSGGGFIATARVIVQVLSTPLVVALSRADGDQEAGTDLVVDASQSRDPDDATVTLNFKWTCTEGNSPCLDPNGQTLLLQSAPELVVSKEKLRVGAKYSISLIVSVRDKSSTQSIIISILSARNLGMDIFTENIRLNAGASRVFYPTIRAPDSTSFLWRQVSGNPLPISTPLTVPWIKIKEGGVVTGDNYRFSLTLTSGGQSLTQFLDVLSNLPPAYGRFAANPTYGVAIIDDFVLQAREWDDPEGSDYPISYQFGVLQPKGAPLYITTPQLTAEATSYFFPGALTLIARLCDSLGSCSTASCSVTVVRPTRLLQSTLGIIKTRFNAAIATLSKIPSTVIAFAYTVVDVVDMELFSMLLGATMKFTAAQSLIDNGVLSTELSCCASLTGLTRVMVLSNVQNITSYITNSLVATVETVSLENIKAAASIFSNLMGRNDVTSEVIRFNALLYTYLSLVPGDETDPVVGKEFTFSASRVVASDPNQLGINSKQFKMQFPSTFLQDMNVASNSVCDLRIIQYQNSNDSSPIISISLYKSGTLSNNNLQLTTPVPFPNAQLTQPVNISFPMNNIVPGISYAAYAKQENARKWSTAGVNLALISYASTIVSTYHFSSFKVAPRERLEVAIDSWPELMDSSKYECDRTYSPVIFNELEILVMLVYYLTVLFIRGKIYKRNIASRCKIEPADGEVPAHLATTDVALPSIASPWLLLYNPIFAFAFQRRRSYLRFLIALIVVQSETLAIGIANRVRYTDWESSLDFSIEAWTGVDFLCCVLGLAIGQCCAWALFALYWNLRESPKLVIRCLIAGLLVVNLAVNAALVWLATLGCDDLLNRWTAEAVAAFIVEVVALSWLTATLMKFAASATSKAQWAGALSNTSSTSK